MRERESLAEGEIESVRKSQCLLYHAITAKIILQFFGGTILFYKKKRRERRHTWTKNSVQKVIGTQL